MNRTTIPVGSSANPRDLEKADASITPIDRFSSSVRRRPKISLPNFPATISVKKTPEVVRIIASLALAVLAAAVASASHLFGVALAIASLLVLFSLWVPTQSAGPGERPRWRGRDLEDNPRLSRLEWRQLPSSEWAKTAAPMSSSVAVLERWRHVRLQQVQ